MIDTTGSLIILAGVLLIVVVCFLFNAFVQGKSGPRG